MCPPQVKFCDYHRMMETDEEEDDVFGKEEDPAPLCDFGVYVEEVAVIVKEAISDTLPPTLRFPAINNLDREFYELLSIELML